MMTEEKIILVTGGNKGIGFATVRACAQAGHTVLLGSRDPQRGDEAVARLGAEGLVASLVHLDVTDQASVDAAAELVKAKHGRLDVLVNNAGITRDRRRHPGELPVSDFREIYETNVFGMVAVTNAMLPLLRAAAAGRIVNLSSGLGSMALTSDPDGPFPGALLLAYNSSKSALNSITVTYANELRDTPIKVNAADPGYCATDLNGHAGPRTPAQGAIAAVRLATLPQDGPTAGFFDDAGTVPW